MFRYIFFLLMLICASINAQNTHYTRVADITGLDFSEYQSVLNTYSKKVIDSMPTQLRNDFHIFDFGYYVHNHAMDNFESIAEKVIEKIELTHDYYLLFARKSDPSGINNQIYIRFAFPDDTMFACIRQRIGYDDLLLKNLEIKANDIIKTSEYNPFAFVEAEKATMAALAKMLASAQLCCGDSSNNSSRSPVSCLACTNTKENFADYFSENYFSEYDAKIIQKISTFDNTKTGLIVSVFGKRFNMDSMITAFTQGYNQLNPNYPALVEVIDFDKNCIDFYKKYEDMGASRSAAKICIGLLHQGQEVKIFVRYNGEFLPIFFEQPLGYIFNTDGKLLVQGSKKNPEVYVYDPGWLEIEKWKLVWDNFEDFDHFALKCYGETKHFDYRYIAHTVVNLMEVREYASQTPNLTTKNVKIIFDRSKLNHILFNDASTIGLTYQQYREHNLWDELDSEIKKAPYKSVIESLRRKKSQPGDGGLLDRNSVNYPFDLNFHPEDPTKGAIQWKGSGDPIGPSNKEYKTKKDFEDNFTNWKDGSNYKKYDTFERIHFWEDPDKQTWATIFQRQRGEFIEKVVIPKAGGGPEYQTARRRAQGAW